MKLLNSHLCQYLMTAYFIKRCGKGEWTAIKLDQTYNEYSGALLLLNLVSEDICFKTKAM